MGAAATARLSCTSTLGAPWLSGGHAARSRHPPAPGAPQWWRWAPAGPPERCRYRWGWGAAPGGVAWLRLRQAGSAASAAGWRVAAQASGFVASSFRQLRQSLTGSAELLAAGLPLEVLPRCSRAAAANQSRTRFGDARCDRPAANAPGRGLGGRHRRPTTLCGDPATQHADPLLTVTGPSSLPWPGYNKACQQSMHQYSDLGEGHHPAAVPSHRPAAVGAAPHGHQALPLPPLRA